MLLGVATGGLSGLLLLSSTTTAAGGDDGGRPEILNGRVTNQYVDDSGAKVREPVADVRITVSTPDNALVGETLTDAAGEFTFQLPGPGDYVVAIDESSLPTDVAVVESTKNPRIIRSNPQSNVTAVFFLGESRAQSITRLSLLPGALFSGIRLAAIIALCSIGLSLIYATTGLSNFAHGELVTLGGIAAWIGHVQFGAALIPAAAAALVVGAVAGLGLERGVWRPMRRRRSSLTSMMIVSIGLSLMVRYVYQFYFSARTRFYRDFKQQSEIGLGPISATPRTLSIIAISVLLCTAVSLFLLRTRQGRAIRAVSDNPSLASSTGINSDLVIARVWMLGGALAAGGGILYGVEIGIKWDTGFSLLLLMFAAVTVGGLGNPFGALLGSVVVGLFVELWAWSLPAAAELKPIGALIMLIVILLIRPQGLLGRAERVG